MKKALLIAALSVSASSFALAGHHEGGHDDSLTKPPEAIIVEESSPAPTPAPAKAVEAVVKAEPAPATEAASAEKTPAPVPAAVSEPKAAPVPAVSVPVQVEPKKKQGASWGYTGSKAAHKWGDLDAQYTACKAGIAQSPVDIHQFVQEDLPVLSGSYSPTPLEVLNNGHTVQVNYGSGSGFRADNKNFNLLQFHFHTPSEHYIDGAPYPMEMHFVHKSADGTLGVIGVMIKLGAHNPVIEGIWQNVPPAGETKRVNTVELSASDLMPAETGYYAYDGSLTTPPCSEGVKWFVMQAPIEMSQAQLVAFQSVFPVNARPVQELGDRVIKGN